MRQRARQAAACAPAGSRCGRQRVPAPRGLLPHAAQACCRPRCTPPGAGPSPPCLQGASCEQEVNICYNKCNGARRVWPSAIDALPCSPPPPSTAGGPPLLCAGRAPACPPGLSCTRPAGRGECRDQYCHCKPPYFRLGAPRQAPPCTSACCWWRCLSMMCLPAWVELLAHLLTGSLDACANGAPLPCSGPCRSIDCSRSKVYPPDHAMPSAIDFKIYM